MDVRVTLVALTMSKAELQLVLPGSLQALPSMRLENGDPDYQVKALALELSGDDGGVERHGFLAPGEVDNDSLTLLYAQILPEDHAQSVMSNDARLIPDRKSVV